jgi:glycosyltransferase involved in cell wall biosynthesis
LPVMLPVVTYLTFDSLQEGVGASQVTRYVERMAAAGVRVKLHSFEKEPPSRALRQHLHRASIEWIPHAFGGHGPRQGALRVLRAAKYVGKCELLHARSDLAAAAALLARPGRWVWDMRSLWAEERIVMGTLRRGSLEDHVLRSVTSRASKTCDAIIALADTAVGVVEDLYGYEASRKTRVVRTCVDLDRFSLRDPPLTQAISLLLSGTLNPYYDLPLTLAFVEAVAARRPARLEVATPDGERLAPLLREAAWTVHSAPPDQMPGLVSSSHGGLSICRADGGVSLKARMPTKIGEFLATGRPVVVNRGLGDMDRLIAEYRCGVAIQGSTPADVKTAAAEFIRLLDDPETGPRCRRVAETYFSIDTAVETLIETYRQVSST